MKLSVGIACCAGLVALGCNPFDDPTPRELIVSTDQPSYRASFVGVQGGYAAYQFQLVVRMQNVGSQQLNIGVPCGNTETPLYSVVMADGKSESAFNPVWTACAPANHPVLAPGETRVYTLTLRGPNAFSSDGPLPQAAGKMFLRLAIGGCKGDGACRDAISNEFDVHLD